MALFEGQQEQFERRANIGRWQIVRVTFTDANVDVVVPHQLPTPLPEQVSYQALDITGPAVIYHDGTPTRRPWGKGYVILRSNLAEVTADILLTVTAAAIGTTTLPQGTFTTPSIDADTLDGIDSTGFARSNVSFVTMSSEPGLSAEEVLTAGTGITIGPGATINATGATSSFSTIAVSGQSNVVADAAADTLTLAAGSNVTITTNAGTDTVTIAASSGGGTVAVGSVFGRLTTESGVAVSTADRTAQATIYFTPYKGNQIALYDGSDWQLMTFSQLSLALSGLTSGKPYDVFVDYNGGTPQLVLGTAWTDDTTRAVALTTQDGVLVLTGATDHRYVGTIYTTATTTTEDSDAKRYVWNAYNRVARSMKNAVESTDSWTHSTTTIRQANANPANQLNYVVGLAEDAVEATIVAGAVTGSAATGALVGIGVDSTTTFTGKRFQCSSTAITHMVVGYRGIPGVGRHFLSWNERGWGSSTQTFYGDGGASSNFEAGITGTVMN